MSFKTGFIVGAAVGYYFGSKAGRERYEQIERQLERVRSHPRYQVVTEKVGEGVEQVKGVAREKASGVAGGAFDSVLGGKEEPSWEPGLEFNPDYRPTEEDIRDDVFGREPQPGRS
jgi:hypothetical protein